MNHRKYKQEENSKKKEKNKKLLEDIKNFQKTEELIDKEG